MAAFLQQYISPALPVILWLFRGVTAGLAVWLLVRCCKSLFRGRDRESWGFVTLSNGARYELYHWENVIGRARRADIRVNFPSVSRTHAILQRDDGGTWRGDPINRSSGVLLNGKRTLEPASLNPGDSIALGGVELFFFPVMPMAFSSSSTFLAEIFRSFAKSLTLYFTVIRSYPPHF